MGESIVRLQVEVVGEGLSKAEDGGFGGFQVG